MLKKPEFKKYFLGPRALFSYFLRTLRKIISPKYLIVRVFLLMFGWFNVALGIIGIVVPGLPTTVFFLIALWAFSKCSKRFQNWLWSHKKFGPPLRAWHEHKVIPIAAKCFAIIMMSISVFLVSLFTSKSWLIISIMLVILVPIAIYILTRNSFPPSNLVD